MDKTGKYKLKMAAKSTQSRNCAKIKKFGIQVPITILTETQPLNG